MRPRGASGSRRGCGSRLRRWRSRIWRASARPPRPKASARAKIRPPKVIPKATSTISLPMPRWVIAVALAKSSTPQRIARASRRASGRRAFTAAISAPSPRKLATSQPTRRIRAAPMTPRHPREDELGQAPGAGNREGVDGHGEEEDEDAPEDDEPQHLRGRPADARAAELRRRCPSSPRAGRRPPPAPRAGSRARRSTRRPGRRRPGSASRGCPGITRTSRVFRSASAAHTRSPHMSVMFRASFRPLRCGNVSRYHAWKAAERLPGVDGAPPRRGYRPR